jgi:hypothetical protein
MVYSTFFLLDIFFNSATNLVDSSFSGKLFNIHLSSLLIYRFLYHFLLALRYRNTTAGNLYVTAIHLQNFGHSILTHSSLFLEHGIVRHVPTLSGSNGFFPAALQKENNCEMRNCIGASHLGPTEFFSGHLCSVGAADHSVVIP